MRLLQDPAFFQNDQPITAAHKRPCIMIQPLAGGIQEASSTLPAPRYPLYVTTVDVGCLVYLKWWPCVQIQAAGRGHRLWVPPPASSFAVENNWLTPHPPEKPSKIGIWIEKFRCQNSNLNLPTIKNGFYGYSYLKDPLRIMKRI